MSEILPAQNGASTRLDRDLTCYACGYNLRTLKPDQTCPECGAEVAQTLRIEGQRRTRPAFLLVGFSVPARFVHLLLGVILPIFPFIISETDNSPGLTRWQSGRLCDYIVMLLGDVSLRPFYPFLLYAIVALLALLIKPAEHGRKTWVVIGTIVGVVMSLQYSLIQIGVLGAHGIVWGVFLMPIALSPATVLYFYTPHRDGENNRKPWTLWQKWVASFIIGAVFVMLTLGTGGWPIGILYVFSPMFCFMIYTLTLARILRTHRLCPTTDNNNLLKAIIPSSALLWLSGGLVAYFLAWIAAIKLAMIEYAKLPTQPPQCYIATAAANGHPCLVRSWPVTLSTGQTILVNKQLQTLKAAELALRATLPRLHRICRCIYDHLGLALASRITHPLLADLAYITLIPFALLATAILKPLVPDFHQHASHFYHEWISPQDKRQHMQ